MDGDVLAFANVMLVIVLSVAAFVGIGLGARILWRWGSLRESTRGQRLDDDRMQRLELAVDSIAIEVERISEAQRFMLGLLSDPTPSSRAALDAGTSHDDRPARRSALP